MSEWQCPLCGSSQFDRWLDRVGPDLSVVQCRQCSLFSLQPRPQPSELPALYPLDYEPFWTPLEAEPSRLRRWLRCRHYAYRYQAVRRAKPGGGWVLDAGCGTGGFVRALCQDPAWHGIGSDFHLAALSLARRQGVNAVCNDLGALPLPPGAFDAVTLWEVIEHVPDPRGTLKQVYRVLKPGGKLLLSTPNGTSWQARFWRADWRGWEAPRHLQLFTLPTLRRLLQDTGFEITRRLSFPLERYHAVASAQRWLQSRVSGSHRRAMEQWASLAGLAAWPVLRLIDRTPFASTIVVEARAVPREGLP